MSKFTFVVNGTVSLYVDVEAKNMDEAIQLAKEAPVQSLCHQCSRGEDGEWGIGEIDWDSIYSDLVDVLIDGDSPKGFSNIKKKWKT